MNGTDPAFPLSGALRNQANCGLTKREMLAAIAMNGFLSNQKLRKDVGETEIAEFSCKIADALIAKLGGSPT